MERMKTC